MKKRNILLVGGILGLIALVLVLLVALPVAFFLFGGIDLSPDSPPESEKPYPGIESDSAIFSAMLKEEGVTLTSNPSNYCLTCNITYTDSRPMDTTLTSRELTSYLQATNNEKGPIKNIRVKLGHDNMAEVTADVDLRDYGYDIAMPVHARGTIEKASDKSIRIDIEKASSGIIPVPKDQVRQGEDALEKLINGHLSRMGGLRIDSLKIEDGELQFKGEFPKTISA